MAEEYVPKTGAVWCGQIITAPRRLLMMNYRATHNWLISKASWTKAERTLFRKWRADFMRPMNVENDKKKRR